MSHHIGRPGSRHRGIWVLTALLPTTMAAASLYQFAVAATAPSLVSDVGLSRLEIGWISGCYYLAAAIASFGLGRHVDRVSTDTATIAIYGLSAVAFAAVAVLPASTIFLVAGVAAGAAAGLSNPTTNRLITAQSHSRGFLVGVKQGGVQLSALVAGSVTPVLALTYGLRNAFAVLGVAVATAGVVSTMALPSVAPSQDHRQMIMDKLPRSVRWLCAYALAMGMGMSAVTIYVVLYGHEEVGLSEAHAGLLLATIGVIGATTRVVSSVVADRGEHLARWLTAGACAAVVGVALIAATTNVLVVCCGVVVVGLSGAAWNGVVILAVLRSCPARLSGHATGIVLTGFFVGLAFGPPMFGAIVDATHSYTIGWEMAGACFAIAALCAYGLNRRDPVLRLPVS